MKRKTMPKWAERTHAGYWLWRAIYWARQGDYSHAAQCCTDALSGATNSSVLYARIRRLRAKFESA